jgi:hypothetical protein
MRGKTHLPKRACPLVCLPNSFALLTALSGRASSATSGFGKGIRLHSPRAPGLTAASRQPGTRDAREADRSRSHLEIRGHNAGDTRRFGFHSSSSRVRDPDDFRRLRRRPLRNTEFAVRKVDRMEAGMLLQKSCSGRACNPSMIERRAHRAMLLRSAMQWATLTVAGVSILFSPYVAWCQRLEETDTAHSGRRLEITSGTATDSAAIFGDGMNPGPGPIVRMGPHGQEIKDGSSRVWRPVASAVSKSDARAGKCFGVGQRWVHCL